MASESTLREDIEDEADGLGWFIDESITDAPLAARESERLADKAGRRIRQRVVFSSLLVVALLVHAALIIAFLYRDAREPIQTAQMQETPVEIVVEKPPEPEKPLPPPEKKPEPPPKPKEDLSPALSAPRAPTEDKVKTETKEAKTAAPTKMETPTQGQPQAAPAVAQPKEETKPAETKKEELAKEEDKTKPDAEALDKARPKTAKAKQPKTKEAKAAPKRKKVPNALAMLSGAPQLDANLSFAKPTPKTKIYGGTEDVRWMSMVEAMLVSKVSKLPRTAHWQDGGQVVIYFHVDVSGRVISREIILKSGYPDIDALAMRALALAAPFPPPPPGLERGLYWGSKFDGQLPVLHVSKR